MTAFLLFILCLLASLAGSICGIGGGVIIKPALDLFGLADAAQANFLSGCTVLAMSLYSVGRCAASGTSLVDKKRGTPLALGAAAGGVAGSLLFGFLTGAMSRPDAVRPVQSSVLILLLLFTLVYMTQRQKIGSLNLSSPYACLAVGAALGLCSSFLGIGGGPINLVVLYYFFSMETKQAAQNSLYIILFSKPANLILLIARGAVPEFAWGTLGLMVLGGLLGAAAGHVLNRRIKAQTVERLFQCLIVLILLISGYNLIQYTR
ncbi:MAG: sulfite exporter TauE/SafE family protein [Clostridiales bacterium]|nr:sulfite exporter TauE/SafE family protein [Clostridiales bacterium]